MAISRHFFRRWRQGTGRIQRAAATALFDGSHEPRAPMKKGRVRLRQLYFLIFLGWPVLRDLGASNVMARIIPAANCLEIAAAVADDVQKGFGIHLASQAFHVGRRKTGISDKR